MTDDGVHKVWCRERESEKEMRVNCLVIEFRGVWRHDSGEFVDRLNLSSVRCLKDIWGIYARLSYVGM